MIQHSIKRYCTIILFFLFSGIFLNTLYAQQKYCEINVQDGKEPLEYANIFINGKYFGYTDSSGNLSVPVWLLKNGDTLAASFIGMEPDTCIFQGQMEQRFSLTPSTELFQVTKTASIRAFHRFYKKNVRVKLPLATQYAFNYKVIKHWNNKDSIKGTGIIKFNNLTYYPKNRSIYYQTELKPAIGDTSGLRVFDILHLSYHIIYILNNFSYWKNKISLKYLGENEKYRVFAWIFILQKSPMRIIIYADKHSHLIMKLEHSLLNFNSHQTRVVFKYRQDPRKGPVLINGTGYTYPFNQFGLQHDYWKSTLTE